ncbi:MAG: extracellular solute-binding protein, partial [Ignavibacteriaceae bacterium]
MNKVLLKPKKLLSKTLKKKLIFFFILLICVSVFSCGNSKKNNNSIVFWSSNNTEEIAFAKKIVDSWNKNQPNKKVSFQPVPEGQSSEEIILAAVVGNTTPDIYSNMWQGDVESYAEAGILVALDTLDGFRDFIYERCDSSVIKEVTAADGHIYQVPWKINPIMLIYNKKIIRDIGFENP